MVGSTSSPLGCTSIGSTSSHTREAAARSTLVEKCAWLLPAGVPGISWSTYGTALAERTAHQSDMTQPAKRIVRLRSRASNLGEPHACSPLILLYEHCAGTRDEQQLVRTITRDSHARPATRAAETARQSVGDSKGGGARA